MVLTCFSRRNQLRFKQSSNFCVSRLSVNQNSSLSSLPITQSRPRCSVPHLQTTPRCPNQYTDASENLHSLVTVNEKSEPPLVLSTGGSDCRTVANAAISFLVFPNAAEPCKAWENELEQCQCVPASCRFVLHCRLSRACPT